MPIHAYLLSKDKRAIIALEEYMNEKTIHGNIDGISTARLEQMKEIYDIQLQRSEFANDELIKIMAKHSSELNREISILVARN